MRKYGNNAVKHFTIRAVQGFPQPAEKGNLRRVQHPAVKMEPLRHSNTAMTALDGLSFVFLLLVLPLTGQTVSGLA